MKVSSPRDATPSDASTVSERILATAIRLFRQRGYHGTSVRELASAVGLETASLYYHYPSKQAILFSLFQRTMRDLVDGIRRAIGSGADPVLQLTAAVRFHVDFHVVRQEEAFVSHSELRALDPAQHQRIIEQRDRYQEALCDVLRAGVAQGHFAIDDVQVTATAILTMCSGVSDWFGAHGRLTGGQIADRYVELVLRMVLASRFGAVEP